MAAIIKTGFMNGRSDILYVMIPVFIFHPIKKAAERPIVMLQCVMAADYLERLEVPAFLTFQKPERI